MKKTTLGLAGALGVAAIVFAGTGERVQLVEAADHIDSPAAVANGPADITDLYSWTWDDGGTMAVALVMAVSPLAAPTDTFSQSVHYVFNIDRGGTPNQVICQFESDDNTAIRCWVGDSATHIIVAGDPTAATVLEQDGVKVFAGQRNDPFAFNGAGFTGVASYLHGELAAGNLSIDGTGCLDISAEGNPGDDGGITTLSAALVRCLQSACDNDNNANGNPIGDQGQGAAQNLVDGANVNALVVSVPVATLAGTGDVIRVHASTHAR